MRAALLWLSTIFALFFAGSFAATFFARDAITRMAQDFVIDRTKAYADPLVGIVEEGINAPALNRALDPRIIEMVRAEVAEYREEPRAYIAKLVADKQLPVANSGQVADLKAKLLFWKSEIRDYFEKTLNRLLFDLRIFFGSNLVAALVALVCAWRGRADRLPRLLLVCGLLLASVVFSAYMYVDSFSYFKILFNSYMGWWYPAVLGITFLSLVVEPGPGGTTSGSKVKSQT
jgi:hypothetical protein